VLHQNTTSTLVAAHGIYLFHNSIYMTKNAATITHRLSARRTPTKPAEESSSSPGASVVGGVGPVVGPEVGLGPVVGVGPVVVVVGGADTIVVAAGVAVTVVLPVPVVLALGVTTGGRVVVAVGVGAVVVGAGVGARSAKTVKDTTVRAA